MKPYQRMCWKWSRLNESKEVSNWPPSHFHLSQVSIQSGPREKRQWRKGERFLIGKSIWYEGCPFLIYLTWNDFLGTKLLLKNHLLKYLTNIIYPLTRMMNINWIGRIGLIPYWFLFSTLAISLLCLGCFLAIHKVNGDVGEATYFILMTWY